MSEDKLHPMSLDEYRSIFDSLYPSLCLFANKYLNDMDASEDIVQEVFIKIWVQKVQYINFCAIKSFLYKYLLFTRATASRVSFLMVK